MPLSEVFDRKQDANQTNVGGKKRTRFGSCCMLEHCTSACGWGCEQLRGLTWNWFRLLANLIITKQVLQSLLT